MSDRGQEREVLKRIVDGAVGRILGKYARESHPGRPAVSIEFIDADVYADAKLDLQAARAALAAREEPLGDDEICPTCGLSLSSARGPDGEPWHEGGVCPGAPCVCGSGWPVSECKDRDAHAGAREDTERPDERIAVGQSRIGPTSAAVNRRRKRCQPGDPFPDGPVNGAEADAINRAYDAMLDYTELPDDFDAARKMAMATIRPFVRDTEQEPEPQSVEADRNKPNTTTPEHERADATEAADHEVLR